LLHLLAELVHPRLPGFSGPGQDFGLLFLYVMLHTLRQHRELGVEALVAGLHRPQLVHEQPGGVMFLFRLTDERCFARLFANGRIKNPLLDVRMDVELRQRLLCDPSFLAHVAALLELLEEILDLSVLLTEQLQGIWH
jgi:hypothetical protein